MSDLAPPYPIIFQGLTQSRVIPFIGAGASLGWVVEGVTWDKDTASRPPTAGELTDYLAKQAVFPKAEPPDLAKVAQYYDTVAAGRVALRRDLHEIFACDYPLADIHTFLAEIEVPLLIVTTNYDSLIVCAFRVTVQGVELSFYPPTIVVPGSKDGARLAQLAASQASVR